MKRFWFLLGLLVVLGHAEYFSDYRRPILPEAPKRISSGDWLGRYATGGLDHWLVYTLDWPLSSRFRVGGEVGGSAYLDGYFASAVTRYRTRGRIRIEEFEEWVSISAGWIGRDAIWDPACGSDCTEWKSAPMMQLGYGRDMLAWSNASFGLRLELKIGAVFGSVLSRLSTGVLGIPETKSGNIMIELRGGVFWF